MSTLDPPTTDRSATDRSATDRSATDRSATDSSATDPPTTDRPETRSAEVSGFLPLKAADCHLLLALSRKPMYGYALLQAMDSDSRGAVGMDIGALYRALDRLMRVGLIGESAAGDAEPNRGRPRRYYAITSLGRRVLGAELARLQGVLEVARVEGAGR